MEELLEEMAAIEEEEKKNKADKETRKKGGRTGEEEPWLEILSLEKKKKNDEGRESGKEDDAGDLTEGTLNGEEYVGRGCLRIPGRYAAPGQPRTNCLCRGAGRGR